MEKTDIIIIGAGISGLICALESLKIGKSVLLIDAQSRHKLGGLARVALGGMTLIGTPEQKSKGIKDSPEMAYEDWCSYAGFADSLSPKHKDYWPKQWAKYYVENSILEVYDYIKALHVSFIPAVNWVERGLYTAGNSVPRYHILWGASLRVVKQLHHQLKQYDGTSLSILFDTKAENLITANNAVIGCLTETSTGIEKEYYADNLVIASGGFTGNLDKVRKVWPQDWGPAQKGLLNGTHPTNDGKMHDCVVSIGGQTTHMENMWNYAAGIPNPNPEFENHGLSLIPCRSALWVDHLGQRIGPVPLVAGFDTLQMCRQINQLQIPHSWQILNRRIALKELAVSGCEHNTAIRDRKILPLLGEILLGNKKLLNKMLKESDHFIMADDLAQLIEKMNLLTPQYPVQKELLTETVNHFDRLLLRGDKFWNDDQIRRIISVRKWPADRLRTCYPKPLQSNGPLIAIKLNLVTRKCLGGIKTDLHCRVLNNHDKPITGLYGIGEAAGFGGGGASGKRSLEGTFLSGCILTARQAARSI